MDPTVCCANREASPLNRKFSKSHVKFLLIIKVRVRVRDRCLSSVSARQTLLLHDAVASGFYFRTEGFKDILTHIQNPKAFWGSTSPFM